MARQAGIEPRIMNSVDAVNDHQKHVMIKKIEEHFDGKLAEKTIAIWGLAFKPRTDDIREAPALVMIERLLEMGTNLQVHDPEAMDNVRALYESKIEYGQQPMDVLEGADSLAINTEWGEFRDLDFGKVK